METNIEKQGTEKKLKEFAFLLSNISFSHHLFRFSIWGHRHPGVLSWTVPPMTWLTLALRQHVIIIVLKGQNSHLIKRHKNTTLRKGRAYNTNGCKGSRTLISLNLTAAETKNLSQTHPSLSLSNTFFSLQSDSISEAFLTF